MAVLYKTLRPLSTGISRDVAPHLLPLEKWVTLQQMRITKGLVENFPGWKSILSSGSVGDYGSLIVSYKTAFGRQLILGGHNKLYYYDSSTRALVDISGALVFNPTLDEKWFPFVYADTLYLTNVNDGLMTYSGLSSVPIVVDDVSSIVNSVSTIVDVYSQDTSGVSPVPGNPPRGRSGQVLNDHLCILYTRDVDGVHPRRFQWAAEGAPATWVPSLSDDAGQFDLNDTPDEGVAFYKLGTGGIVYKSENIYSITYTGGNEVFTSKREADIGLLGPFALINKDTEHYVMGNRQFFRYRGGSNIDQSFGREVHNVVYPRLHPTLKWRACGLHIESTDEFIFFYPTTTSTGRNNEAVVYSRRYNAWSGPFAVSLDIAGTGSSGVVIPVDAVSSIVDSVSTVVDVYPQGIIGSELSLFIDDTGDVVVIDPTVQTAKGSPITRVLESGETELSKDSVTLNGQVVSLPSGMVLTATVLNLEVTFVQVSGTIQVFVGHKMELSETLVYAGPYTVSMTSTGTYRVPIRATGRWFSVRIVLPNSMVVTFAGMQYEASPVGRR